MALGEIIEVSLFELPGEQLWGRNLEVPQPGSPANGGIIEIIGWVLGRQAPAVAIEVVAEGRVLRREKIDIRRPDVAAHYPEVVGGEQSGFHTWVRVDGISDRELLVQAVLQDHSRVPLACLHVRRRWRDSPAGGEAPLVSVIIPCYNQAHFLGEAIESVLAQSYPHFEIIVVDDGSTDNTEEVAGSYPEVRCLRQANQGQAAARNVGLGQSCGEYAVFLDADDRLMPEALAVGLAGFAAHPDCAFVAGHHRWISADGFPLQEIPPHSVEKEHYAELLRRNYIAMLATVMYRRSILDSIGGFNPSLRLKGCEDYDLYLRIAWQFPIYCHDQVVAEYRQHGASTSHDSALMLKAVLAMLRSQWQEVKGNAQYRKAYKIGWRVYQGLYGRQLVGEIRTRMRKREWRPAMNVLRVLLRYYPRGFISLVFTYPPFTYPPFTRIREIVRRFTA